MQHREKWVLVASWGLHGETLGAKIHPSVAAPGGGPGMQKLSSVDALGQEVFRRAFGAGS